MARKGREPLVVAPPPAASSSDEEDDSDSSSDEEQPQQLSQPPQQQQNHHSSSEEDDDEEEDEQQQPPTAPQNYPSTPPSTTKKGPTHKKPEPTKPTESDSDSDSDSDLPPAKVKPISSRPMETTKPRSKPNTSNNTVTVATPGKVTPSTSKRQGSGDTDKGSVKKAKKEKVVDEVGSGLGVGSEKKPLFQRVWSGDDEIVILKGMIDYKEKKKADPLADADDFLEFIKKSLHVVDVNKGQMVNKIRRLKKKYENCKQKKKISNAHELNAFALSKKIWGSGDDGVVKDSNGVVENSDGFDLKLSSVKSKGKSGSKSNTNSNAKEDVIDRVLEDEKKRSEEDGEAGNCAMLGSGFNVGLFNEEIMKEGMKLVDRGQSAELAEKWRRHNVLEMELFVKRLDLMKESAQAALSALKSAKQ